MISAALLLAASLKADPPAAKLPTCEEILRGMHEAYRTTPGISDSWDMRLDDLTMSFTRQIDGPRHFMSMSLNGRPYMTASSDGKNAYNVFVPKKLYSQTSDDQKEFKEKWAEAGEQNMFYFFQASYGFIFSCKPIPTVNSLTMEKMDGEDVRVFTCSALGADQGKLIVTMKFMPDVWILKGFEAVTLKNDGKLDAHSTCKSRFVKTHVKFDDSTFTKMPAEYNDFQKVSWEDFTKAVSAPPTRSQ